MIGSHGQFLCIIEPNEKPTGCLASKRQIGLLKSEQGLN
jgi:hypothetical protein